MSPPIRKAISFLRRDDGAIAVEFVIIFPVIMLLCFFIVFISMLISATSDIQQVAHELARASFRHLNAASGEPEDLCARMRAAGLVEELARSTLFVNPGKVILLDCPGQPTSSGLITVTVTYNFVGDYVQSLGASLGWNTGQITRTSTTRL